MNVDNLQNFIQQAAPVLKKYNANMIIFGGAACLFHGIREETKDIDVALINDTPDLRADLEKLATSCNVDLCCDILTYWDNMTLDSMSDNVYVLTIDTLLASKIYAKRHPSFANDADDVVTIMIKKQYSYDKALNIAKYVCGKDIKPTHETWLDMITQSNRYRKNINLDL